MFRLAASMGLATLMLAAPAAAGQAHSSFQVGITILPPQAEAEAAVTARPKAHRLATHFVKRLNVPRRYTWGAAAVSLTRAGFHGLARQGQVGFVYLFTAQKAGAPYCVAVSAASGAILKITAL